MTSPLGPSALAGGRKRWPADEWRDPLLVVRLSSLGDVILTSGPLRLLRERRADLRIDFLTRRAFVPVAQGMAGIDRVIASDEADAQSAAGAAGALQYGQVLDWQGGVRGAQAVRCFAGTASRVGAPRATLHRRALVWLGRRIPPPESFVCRLARSIAGGPIAAERLWPELSVDAPLHAFLAGALRARGGEGQRWVVLAPGASRRMKAIPEPLCTAIADGFARRGWGVILLSAPGADGACADPAGRLTEVGPGSLEFCGPLPAVIALLACARLFVGSDSGILHLATAVSTPAIGLFGSTVPELGFSPLGTSRVIGVDLPCRPCHIHGAQRCWMGHARCWQAMSPAWVFAAAEELIGAGAGLSAQRGAGVPCRGSGDSDGSS